jgi:hypothetical protein
MTTYPSSTPDPRWADRPIDAVELRFGNAIMPLRCEELGRLRLILRERVSDHVPDSDSSAEHTVLWLGDEGVGVRFTRDESRRLLALVEQTVQRLSAQTQGAPWSAELAREVPPAVGATATSTSGAARAATRRPSGVQGGIA